MTQVREQAAEPENKPGAQGSKPARKQPCLCRQWGEEGEKGCTRGGTIWVLMKREGVRNQNGKAGHRTGDGSAQGRPLTHPSGLASPAGRRAGG